MHNTIGNFKVIQLGIYHWLSSKYLQEYLNEFCYRFNRRAQEIKLPLRLINACLTHAQVILKKIRGILNFADLFIKTPSTSARLLGLIHG